MKLDTQIVESMTVNEVIRLFPQTVDVFNRFGIDACCGGAVLIAEASERDGAATAEVMEALVSALEGGR